MFVHVFSSSSSRQSVNQSINQIHPSIHQSINRSVNQSIIQTTNQSVNQSINQSINQPINQSISQPTKQPTELYLYTRHPIHCCQRENFFWLSVDIFCDVITGVLDVTSIAGDGHRGQDGGRGEVGPSRGDTVRRTFTVYLQCTELMPHSQQQRAHIKLTLSIKTRLFPSSLARWGGRWGGLIWEVLTKITFFSQAP